MVEPSLLEQVLQLPAEDRQELIHELTDSLANEEPLSPELRALADERLADAQANPLDGDSWDVVRKRIWESTEQ